MRKQIIRTISMLIFVVTLGVMSAHAQANNPLKAHIPFDFAIGNQTFKAGDYTIARVNPQSDQTVLSIKSADGRESRVVSTTPVQGAIEDDAKLVFNNYEGRYFLAQVWMAADNTGLKLRASHQERELAKNNAPRETVTLIAQR